MLDLNSKFSKQKHIVDLINDLGKFIGENRTKIDNPQQEEYDCSQDLHANEQRGISFED